MDIWLMRDIIGAFVRKKEQGFLPGAKFTFENQHFTIETIKAACFFKADITENK